MILSGFFNAIDEDRKYDADDMSLFFAGLITDGVFANIGEMFRVEPVDSKNPALLVKEGKCWLNNRWMYNNSDYRINNDETTIIKPAHETYDRIDVVYISINNSEDKWGRTCTIEYMNGEATQKPVPPDVNKNVPESTYNYPIAYITVKKGTNNMINNTVEQLVGKEGYIQIVDSLIDSDNVQQLYERFSSEWSVERAALKKDYDAWFAGVKSSLDSLASKDIQTVVNSFADLKAYIENIGDASTKEY